MMTKLIGRELGIQRPLSLSEMIARAEADDEPPMTLEEVVAEVKEYRRERRARNATCG